MPPVNVACVSVRSFDRSVCCSIRELPDSVASCTNPPLSVPSLVAPSVVECFPSSNTFCSSLLTDSLSSLNHSGNTKRQSIVRSGVEKMLTCDIYPCICDNCLK